MIGLVDGDIIVFRCAFAAERNEWHLHIPKDKDGEEYKGVFEYKREAMDELDKRLPAKRTRKEGEEYRLFPELRLEPLSHALQNVKTLMKKIADANGLNEFDIKVYLSNGPCYRHRLAKTRPYKANRDDKRRPTYEKEVRQYMIEQYDTYIADDEEADDMLGIQGTKEGPHGAIIITLDKDLDQVPGLKYNFMHEVGYEVTENQAHYNFCIQLMSGDSTDNIPGLPKIGPGKAKKALHGLEEDPEAMMQEVMRMYMIHSGKEDWLAYLREQGQLLYIRRQDGEMWEPPVTEADDPYAIDVDLFGENT
ncbi:MAG: hypothetical protein ACYTBJ_18520 [Planctomycetota bacterium]|jgi:hypothetical protein